MVTDEVQKRALAREYRTGTAGLHFCSANH